MCTCSVFSAVTAVLLDCVAFRPVLGYFMHLHVCAVYAGPRLLLGQQFVILLTSTMKLLHFCGKTD